MKQLTQQLKDGAMELLETPFPAMKSGHVLVRTHFSVISAGTEGKTVKDARLGYIGKAKARKDEVKKVITMAQTQGLAQTYNTVMSKLEAPSALGYSCAGQVLEIGAGVEGISVGDIVACGGAGAVHSEVVCVPKNLCVKLTDPSKVKEGAFATIAAIAMQGIRQADLRLGENCVVIGLGLIGQLTVQMLKAAGVKVVGVDIDQNAVDLALKSGADLALNRSADGIEDAINEATRGAGADAIIITAATSSNDPVEFAGLIARKKAKVVIVGAVPTGFSRKHYYQKELDLRMSSSYGPGRYDVEYEDKGHDYPIGYVRWTEQRNMQAYLDLLEAGKIEFDHLLSHEFAFEEAPKAYDMIHERSEPFVGIVLKYNQDQELKRTVHVQRNIDASKKAKVGFAGAGSFAQNYLLPNLKGKVDFTGVITARSNTAKNIQDKYGFQFASTDADELMKDATTNTVFVATRHDLHGEMVLKALKADKHVFVEKPLCLKEEELERIAAEYTKHSTHLMLGFNRRFAPLITALKKQLNPASLRSIHYRINAGILPTDHWVHDLEVGGGRIIGEACHFIDLAAFIADSRIKHVSAQRMTDAKNVSDTVTIQMQFENGSIASIDYLSNGSKELMKEYIEVFSGGVVYQLNDFQELLTVNKGVKKVKQSGQDKGHKKEVEAFIASIQKGGETPIAFDAIYNAMKATFAVIQSYKNSGERITL
ncbi:MAG: Gfo/Idh/MocA family oxidoreductase [Flavobacteriales bacterium]|nr:Gfo/Idh/MocA family oxidoreductase [Flavobacteriales bacterium]